MPREHVLNHGGDDFRAEGRGVDLADALDAAGGPELQEHKVAAAVAGRRIADDEYFYVLEFHGLFLVLWNWPASSSRDEIGGLLSDHERGSVGIGGGDRRKYRGVDDAQAIHSVHAQGRVDHETPRVSFLQARAHPAGADRVVDRRGACAKVGDEIRIAHAQQIRRERLAYQALN